MWAHPNKRAVSGVVASAGVRPCGQVRVSRWRELAIPAKLPSTSPKVVQHLGFFTYTPPRGADVHWHLNFADVHLFGFGEGALLAQDELQAMEHPTLISVRDAMANSGDEHLAPRTREGAAATPVLVHNVPRLCAFDTAPSEKRPVGLYGNRFASASTDAIAGAVQVLNPPTTSNILAIAAPSPSTGFYSIGQIRGILGAAYAGFRAAVLDSEGPAVLHTGFWGCGAFGGNRHLMTQLQLLAAGLADIAEVHFWFGTPEGEVDMARGVSDLYKALPGSRSVDELIEALVDARYPWGVSDGN